MKKCSLLKLATFVIVALGATLPMQAENKIETDDYTVRRLRRDLVSGSEFFYPAEAVRLKLDGLGRFSMNLLPDGKVDSVKTLHSTGHVLLDNYVKQILMTYRFKRGTKGPVPFPVRFLLPNSRIQMWE